jgi:hypothetical protein
MSQGLRLEPVWAVIYIPSCRLFADEKNLAEYRVWKKEGKDAVGKQDCQ